MTVRREKYYCAECRGVATQLVQRIFGTGDFGLTVQYGLCEKHCAELVRSTTDRYVITPMPRGRRRRRQEGEQLSWNVDAP